jgi:hypothetical protein
LSSCQNPTRKKSITNSYIIYYTYFEIPSPDPTLSIEISTQQSTPITIPPLTSNTLTITYTKTAHMIVIAPITTSETPVHATCLYLDLANGLVRREDKPLSLPIAGLTFPIATVPADAGKATDSDVRKDIEHMLDLAVIVAGARWYEWFVADLGRSRWQGLVVSEGVERHLALHFGAN